jgi:hypothetical protein
MVISFDNMFDLDLVEPTGRQIWNFAVMFHELREFGQAGINSSVRHGGEKDHFAMT